MGISGYTIRNCVFGVKCNSSWDDMRVISQGDETGDIGRVRFCNTCQKEVFECIDNNELVENIRLNRCVTFMPDDLSLPRLTDDIVRVIKHRE